ncbi:MAG: DUF3795 domain-containing protein [bacterium]
MSEILAYCGLVCHTCPIYLATREPDTEKQNNMRLDIVKECNEKYHLNYTLDDITDCDGCLTEGTRLFAACSTCPIRTCARKKEVINCAYCPEYPCTNLTQFFKSEPSAKARLDKIKQ